ncbi:g3124 [Coccomyxa viridis]|uniref:G3124 protein n=1 Tax=Coccomyxa viridis TaxID=1274662 RepID=A0ABP1FS63_9CHLO
MRGLTNVSALPKLLGKEAAHSAQPQLPGSHGAVRQTTSDQSSLCLCGDAKHVALKRGKDIRAKGFGIDVDLTPAQQQQRNLKRSRFTALKEQNMFPFWKGARLFYRQGDQVLEDLGPRPPTAPPPPSQNPRSRTAPPPPPSQAPSSSAGPPYALVAMP